MSGADDQANATPGRPVDPEGLTTVSGGAHDPGPGEQIGPYRLREVIGEGGFGTVYLAEQHEPIRRQVALKIIKLGMDTREVIGRFEIERQALALMSHPNIAAVLDAGATDRGRPYFVMELVRGKPITHYCDDHQLSTEERLKLFASVCRAVQHAHQKGVIHRDLKPSNVLVTDQEGVPTPKVIDFGIAKAVNQPLTDATVYTRVQQIVGTPAYMSPEQSRTDATDIDTRADVYSLGALLYELLTGRPPLVGKDDDVDYEEFKRRVREVDPPTPSTLVRTASSDGDVARLRGVPDVAALRRELKGELDWIVMKAIEKDRNRRYDTALGLALDVERRLRNEAVTAAPPSAAYRFRKLVDRNRGVFATGAVVMAALVGGLALASWGLLEARIQRDRALAAQAAAESEARKAAEVNRYLNDILSAANPNVTEGEDVTVRALLEEAAARLEAGDLSDEPDVRAELLRTIGDNYNALGRFDEAEAFLLDALDTARAGELGDPAVAQVLERLGVVLLKKGDYETATERFQLALDLRLSAGQPDAETMAARGGLAEAAGMGADLGAAEARYREALAILDAADVGETLDRAALLNGLGQILSRTGRYPESIASFQGAIDIYRARFSERNSSLASALNNQATAYEAAGLYDDAERVHRDALATRRALFGDEHDAVANSLGNLGLVLYRLDQFEEAEAMQRQALAINEANLPAMHFRLAINRSNLALALAGQGRMDEADALLGEALDIAAASLPPEHMYFPVVRANRADLWRQAGRLDEAESGLLAAYEDLAALIGAEHSRTRLVAGFLARLYEERGEVEEAGRWRALEQTE